MQTARPPCYTMQTRSSAPAGITRKDGYIPGPNQYLLPSSLGPKVPNKPAAAAYSITGKPLTFENKKSIPGPNQYGDTNANVYKKKSPSFSMGGRFKPAPEKNKTPGPGAYSPKFGFGGKQNPSFSFHIKHRAMPLITPEDTLGYKR